MQPAQRAEAIAPFQVMSILERAKALAAAGRDVIHMEVGEPRFPLPEPLVEAARHALAERSMGYTPSAGLPELRVAIAARYGECYGVDIDPRRVIVTPGGSGALQLALGTALDVADGALVPDPGYPCHAHIATLLGARVLRLPLAQDNGWRVTAGLASRYWSDDVKALVLASPANPTGAVVGAADMGELVEFARQRRGVLVVDETYQGLVYGADNTTALAQGEDVLVVNSFSKYFGLTGWRLGWVVVPSNWVAATERLAQNLYLAAPTLAQHIGLAALRPDVDAEFQRRRRMFERRRDLLLDALPALGFKLGPKPCGAFYVFAAVPDGHEGGAEFTRELLEREAVAVTPGTDFGSGVCRQMVRFAYTEDEPRLRAALARLAQLSPRS